MRRHLLAAVAVLAVLGACSAPESGVVYKKDYSAPWSYWDSTCMRYDKQGLCALKMPIEHHIPPAWYLCLRNGEETGCRSVDPVTFHKYEVGQEYP